MAQSPDEPIDIKNKTLEEQIVELKSHIVTLEKQLHECETLLTVHLGPSWPMMLSKGDPYR